MVKKTGLAFLSLFLCLAATCQQIGYTTTDVGAELQGYPSGTQGTLHMALNAALHHSLQIRLGYETATRTSDIPHDREKARGAGLGLGYRYYFTYRPHGLFLGARTDLYRLKTDWTSGSLTGTSKTWTLQPAAELGYMFLINDQVFITPSVAAGYGTNLQTTGDRTWEGFLPMAGVSAGIKF
ncbi:MAG TPA: outer membrane beta-barrel protein [Chitinophagaceae bacterium]|nr:outer membrane beta-barrel protein [Chitinophagaceae bacterium]